MIHTLFIHSAGVTWTVSRFWLLWTLVDLCLFESPLRLIWKVMIMPCVIVEKPVFTVLYGYIYIFSNAYWVYFFEHHLTFDTLPLLKMAFHCGFHLHLLVSRAPETTPYASWLFVYLCVDMCLGFGCFLIVELQKYLMCLVYGLPMLLPLSVAFAFSSVCFWGGSVLISFCWLTLGSYLRSCCQV